MRKDRYSCYAFCLCWNQVKDKRNFNILTQKNSIDHIYLKPTIIPLSKQWALKTAYIEQLYRALFLAMIDLSLSLIEGKPGKL